MDDCDTQSVSEAVPHSVSGDGRLRMADIGREAREAATDAGVAAAGMAATIGAGRGTGIPFGPLALDPTAGSEGAIGNSGTEYVVLSAGTDDKGRPRKTASLLVATAGNAGKGDEPKVPMCARVVFDWEVSTDCPDANVWSM